MATEYGEQLLGDNKHLEISHERFNQGQMEELILKNHKPLVIDATHPYAAEVTKNIQSACENTGVEYLRVLRENQDSSDLGDCVYVETVEAAVDYLQETKGNILATTGSKEAVKYTALSDLKIVFFAGSFSAKCSGRMCPSGISGKKFVLYAGTFFKGF